MKHNCTYTKLAVAAAAAIVSLTACGKQTSAVAPAAEPSSSAAPGGSIDGYGPSSGSGGGQPIGGSTANSVAMINGKPMWAANRKHTAQENAQYQFTKNGSDFGAANESEYLRKVHELVDHPPTSVETLDRRNGDKLLYDPKGNIFAVVSRDGAPRTMFKPRSGSAYWDEQKKRTNAEAAGGGSAQNAG